MPKFNIFKVFASDGGSSRNGGEVRGKLRKNSTKTRSRPVVPQPGEARYLGHEGLPLSATDEEPRHIQNGSPIDHEAPTPDHLPQSPEIYPDVPNDYSYSGARRPYDSLGSSHQPPREASWSPIPSVHRESTQITDVYDRSRGSLTDEEKWVQNFLRGEGDNQFDENQIRREQALASMALDVNPQPGHGQEPRHFAEMGSHERDLKALPIMDPSERANGFLRDNDYSKTIEPAIYEREFYDSAESEPDVYQYIVPAGLDIIFQDEAGNEIARVGKFSKPYANGKSRGQNAPIIVMDEFGKELYRSNPVERYRPPDRLMREGHLGHDSRQLGPNSSTPFPSGPGVPNSPSSNTSSSSTRTIIIDKKGNQTPIKTTNGSQIVPKTSKHYHGHHI